MKHFKLMKGVLACLLSLVLVATSIAPTNEISAAETATTTTTVVAPVAKTATYTPNGDYISSSDGGKIVYVLKAEKGNTIKKGAKCYELSSTATENTLTAIGVKSTAKDAYLYVCDKEFEEDGKNINANLVIKGQAAKKITAVIDYTQADDLNSTTVLSIKAVDKNKKNLENPVCIWSEDGTTWNTADKFNGAALVKYLEAGGGTIQVKMLGEANVRTSKAIKVKIAKQGKAPTVKVDVKKDTFSIKNGMDFGLFVKKGDKYTLVENTTWHTVLPQLKTAATKTLEASIVSTKSYTPLNKKDTNATKAITDNKVAYTSVKVKAVGFDVLTENLRAGSGENIDIDNPAKEYYVGVRTSATEKKPASAVTYFKYSNKALAPIVYTESNVKGQYLVASGADFAKKGIVLGTIANYNGENGTKGYDDSFELKANQKDADTAAAAYEFAIVNKADLMGESGECTIDWSSVSWKKLDPAKTKFSAKTKTKYNTLTKSGITATLSAGSLSGEVTTGDIPDDVKTVILVRRTGVKGKTADEATLASYETRLYVLKNGKNYEIYSTKDNGEAAAKYTVNFYKWTGTTSGESTTYGWAKDDSLTITGWGGGSGASTKEKITFPTVENANFWLTSGSGSSLNYSGSGLTLTNGQYEYEVTGTDAHELNVIIREYANVKLVANTAISGETTGTESALVNVTNGKVGNATTVTAYVGAKFEVKVTDPTVTNYNVAIGTELPEGVEKKTSSSGETTLEITVNSAKEETIKVPYVKTPKTFKVATLNNTGNLTTSTAANAVVTYGTDYEFTVTGDVDKVTYAVGTGSATEIAGDAGKYVIPGDKITADLTITITKKAST